MQIHRFVIQEEDTDKYGHLNNSRFSRYFLLAHEAADGPKGPLVEARYAYARQVHAGDRVEIHRDGNATYTMRRDETIIATAAYSPRVLTPSLATGPSLPITTDGKATPLRDDFGLIRAEDLPLYFDISRENTQESYGIKDITLIERGIGLFVTIARYVAKLTQTAYLNTAIASGIHYDGGARLQIHHAMISDGNVIARAQTTHAFIDISTGRPIRPLEDIIDRIRARHPARQESAPAQDTSASHLFDR
ncbi:MAG: hypothetical protein ABIH41_03935 [Nanoarchaeota archaeon]